MGRATVITVIASAGLLLILAVPLYGQLIPFPSGDQLNYHLQYDNAFPSDLSVPNITSVETSRSGEQFYSRLKYEDAFINDLLVPNILLVTPNIPRPKLRYRPRVDRDFLNKLTDKPKVDEKEQIRQAWKDTLGIDVWYPYYKAEQIEDWVREKASVRIFKLKCKPKFQKNSIVYTCKTRF